MRFSTVTLARLLALRDAAYARWMRAVVTLNGCTALSLPESVRHAQAIERRRCMTFNALQDAILSREDVPPDRVWPD